MNSTINHTKILNKICKSSAFSNANVYQDLLKYLFQCFKQNYSPSETDIATNVLGKGNNFNPIEDSSVRVYVYKLRKKLKQYYENEGKSDEYKLEIPKGHYDLCFTKREVSNKLLWNTNKLLQHIPGVSIGVLGIIIILFVSTKTDSNRVDADLFQNNFIWDEILTNNKTTIIALEHDYSFYELDPELNRIRLIYDSNIQSDEDFAQFKANEGQNRIFKKPNWSIIPEVAAHNTAMILPILIRNEIDYSLKLTTDLLWEDFTHSNIIYFGNYFHMEKLEQFFPSGIMINNKNIIHYIKEDSNILRVKNDVIDTSYQYISPMSNDDNYIRDYFTLAKVPGPNNSVIIYLTSIHTIGRKHIVEVLTNPFDGKQIYGQFLKANPNISPFFVAVIEVEGFEKTALHWNVKHLINLEQTEHLSLLNQ